MAGTARQAGRSFQLLDRVRDFVAVFTSHDMGDAGLRLVAAGASGALQPSETGFVIHVTSPQTTGFGTL